MTSIQSQPHGTAMPVAEEQVPKSSHSASAGSSPAGVAIPVPGDVSGEQLEMAKVLEDASGEPADASSDDGEAEPATNANGAPWLPPPGADLSADYLAALLSFYNSQSAEFQIAPLQEQLKTRNEGQLQELERSNKIIDKNIALAKKATAARKASGIMGWVKKSLNIVTLAVGLQAISKFGGPGGTMFKAMAAGVLINTIMRLSSDISTGLGGPKLPESMSAALQLATVALLKEVVHDDKLAESLGLLMSGLIGCYTGAVVTDPAFAGQLAGGAAMLGGTGEAKAEMVMAYTTVAATVATAIAIMALSGGAGGAGTGMQALQAANAVIGVTQAAVSIYDAKVNFDVAMLRAKQVELMAKNKEISAHITRLQSQWEDAREELNRVIEALNSNYSVIASILNSDHENKSGIIARMNGRATV